MVITVVLSLICQPEGGGLLVRGIVAKHTELAKGLRYGTIQDHSYRCFPNLPSNSRNLKSRPYQGEYPTHWRDGPADGEI